MNKKPRIIAAILAVIIIGFVVMYFPRTDTKHLSQGRIVCCDELSDKNEELTKEEEEKIKEMFSNKKLLRDNPSCGFDDRIGFEFADSYGNKVFYSIGLDSCGTIYDKKHDRYFDVENSDSAEIKRIFSAHRIAYPSV